MTDLEGEVTSQDLARGGDDHDLVKLNTLVGGGGPAGGGGAALQAPTPLQPL